MRRLALLVLLLLPSTARADEFPSSAAFIGCTNPLTGCIQGIMTPRYSGTVDAIVYEWFITSCERCEESNIGFNRLTLYGAAGTAVYSYRLGNVPGGGTIHDQPIFGIFEGFNPGNPTAAVIVTTTPEPVAMALIGTGLAVIGVARRRRQLGVQRAA